MEQGSLLSPGFSLLSRNTPVKFLIEESSLFPFTVSVTHIRDKQTQSPFIIETSTEAALQELRFGPPVGWCVLECILIIEATQCKAIISTGLTTTHHSRHCSTKKRLVPLYSDAMWHFSYSHLQSWCAFFFFLSALEWHGILHACRSVVE